MFKEFLPRQIVATCLDSVPICPKVLEHQVPDATFPVWVPNMIVDDLLSHFAQVLLTFIFVVVQQSL